MLKLVLVLYVGVLGQQRGLDLVLNVGTSTRVTGSSSRNTGRAIVTNTTRETTTTTTVTRTGTSTRSGSRLRVSEQVQTINEGDRVVSSDVIPFMRSRNIEFTARRFKPRTRLYGFFDGTDLNQFVVPKLIEIRMISGVFTNGELVTGTMPSSVTPTTQATPRLHSELLILIISLDQLVLLLIYSPQVLMMRTILSQHHILVPLYF